MLNLAVQEGMINPILKVFVVGCGAVGSNLIMGLAKSGFSAGCADHDKFESRNVPTQFVAQNGLGDNKAIYMGQVSRFFTGLQTVETWPIKVDFQTIVPGQWDILVLCPDNLPARKEIFEHRFDIFPDSNIPWVVDVRTGRNQVEVICADMNDKAKIPKYIERLNVPVEDQGCGSRSTSAISLLSSGLALMAIQNISMERTPPFLQIYNGLGNQLIVVD